MTRYSDEWWAADALGADPEAEYVRPYRFACGHEPRCPTPEIHDMRLGELIEQFRRENYASAYPGVPFEDALRLDREWRTQHRRQR